MRLISLAVLLTALAAQTSAQTISEDTPWLVDAGQFVAGAGSDAVRLIDGNPSTVWTSRGASFTVRLPEGMLDGTPFRIRFTIPATGSDMPVAYCVYGSHEENGELKGENKFGHTTARIAYDGSMEYISPTFYVRGGFNNQWWLCTHIRFECTETASGESPSFSLADFSLYGHQEYTVGEGAMFRNNGDIINSAGNNQGNDWYKPLVDEQNDSYWDANAKGDWLWQGHQATGLTVTPQPVAEETHYTLKIGRTAQKATGFPTSMKWSYRSSDNGLWLTGGTIDLSDVAPGEIRDVDFMLRPEYYQLKFETVANVGNECIASWAGGLPNTVLSRFQMYGPVRVYTPVPDPLPNLGIQYPNPNKVSLSQDYFHTKLYSRSLVDFSFEHTHGIVDKNFDNNFNADGGWLTDLDIWDSDGHLREGVIVPGAAEGVELPDFSYDAKVTTEIVPVEEDGRRQPTNTIIHEVYAIPGERVDLVPYSDIWHRSNYFEDFYRFYDYASDKAHPDVYFLYNPRAGAYNEHGIFGGRALGYVFDDADYGTFDWNDNSAQQRGTGGVASFYRPADGADGYIDEYIAADYSQHYYVDGQLDNDSRKADVLRFIDTDGKVIHEPIINFRHIFHVIDGRKFAEESSANREVNRQFLGRTRQTFYSRAGSDFTIRLINHMPSEDGMHSNFYYKRLDGSYSRMGTYDIETYPYENNEISGAVIPGMFIPDERSAYRTVDVGLETELNPGGVSTDAWIEPDQKFYRALRCNAANARKGTYLIRLIAKTPEGDRILLEDGEPLALREIIITFLDEEHASFELEDDIPEKHNEDYLDENFHSRTVVDFDKYKALSGTSFVEKEGRGERTKYPAAWLNSDYAFGYKYKQDYSTYMIASHADCVPYSSAAISESDRHDRLWSKTGGREQGFFYYANAAGDQGVMARIRIPMLCVGSTIHVSAWINSMSVYMDNDYDNNEPANVNFDLVAIMKDGREVNINNFSSGYVPNDPEHCGKWMHAYYSVTPDFSILDNGNFNVRDVDYYQIILVNNSVNSSGADYAIDDIRIYVSKPEVQATQLRPLCQGDNSVSQRLDMPYRNLVNSLGLEEVEGHRDVTVYYTIFDKEKYEAAVAEEGGFTRQVFEQSALTFLDSGGSARWGAITFNTDYDSNPLWDIDAPVNVASRFSSGGVDCISFNVILEDYGLCDGKTYIAVLSVPGENELPEWTDFDISDICTRQSEFSVKGSTVIKIDGIVKTGTADVEICENQFPVIQVDIYGIEAVSGDVKIVDETPLVDWFKGDMEAYSAASFNAVPLDEALLNFRHIYPEATDTRQPFVSEGVFSYKEEYRAVIEHFIDEGLLDFASYSFLSDAVRLPEGQSRMQYCITVIPANRQEDREIDGKYYTVCNDPAELRINVTSHAPGLLDGFENIDYPASMLDVPLRAGLRQLDADLHMPMRNLYIVTPSVARLRPGSDNSVYLVKTNDPEFRNLELEPGASTDGTGLRPVGTLMALEARRGEADRCSATVRLSDTGFKEGYYYTVRFDYAEDTSSGVTSLAACEGQAIFSVKVVAEYQMWTGGAEGSSNFNNDGNWRRVSYEELSGDSAGDDFVTDGSNKTEYSYSPLSFTKTIIPAGEKYPRLLEPAFQPAVTVYDGDTYMAAALATDLSDDGAVAGCATRDIEYDLVALEKKCGIYCRMWRPNVCGQIHFKATAEIGGQHYLDYGKAWADMELASGRWYTLSSPLQDVVAGDMYLPSATARQETELFQPVTFVKGVNDRFRPAVYQRGWDRGSATVYELPSASAAERRNVAVALDWSDVYNDVREACLPGLGFSVKADVSAMNDKAPEAVLFRFPKDDADYEYWTADGLDHGIENGAGIGRDSAYRLNPVDFTAKLTNHTPGRYFLVGNPFMAHLDMKRFMEVNKDVINPKYWIMTQDSQQCAVMDASSGGFVSTVGDAGALAPMQGFFVESVATAQSLSLRFTPDMITLRPLGSDGAPRLLSRAGGEDGTVVLGAIDAASGETLSQALLRVSADANSQYDAGEDVLLLFDSSACRPEVCTLADGNAVAINSLPDAAGTEIALVGGDARDVILRFDNISAIDGLSLVDLARGLAMPLHEGMEYRVDGDVSGRLFLTSDARLTDGLCALGISVCGAVVSAQSPAPAAAVRLRVYDAAGHAVASAESTAGRVSAEVAGKGFFVAEATDSEGNVARRKIIIR